MNNLINSEILNAIGWAIIHSLWQVGLLSIFLFIVLKFLRGYSANLKYWFSSITLFASSFLFIRSIFNSLNTNNIAIESDVQNFSLQIDTSLSNLVNSGSFSSTLERILPYLVIAYLFGLGIFTLRFISGIFNIYKLKTSGIVLLNKKWKTKLNILLKEVGVRQDVKIFESFKVTGPVVVGYLKPIILFPIGLLSSMNPEEVEAIIRHELAHIKRNDFVINMLQCIIETIMFYNPFIWWISNTIRKEREYCCDELAIEGTTPITYAKALANISLFEHKSSLITAANSNRSDLFKRIKHITSKSTLKRKTMDKFITAIILLGSSVLLSWYSIDLDDKIKIDELSTKEIREIPNTESRVFTVDTIPSDNDLQKVIIEQKREIARLKNEIEKSQKSLNTQFNSDYKTMADSINLLARELSKRALEEQELASKLQIEDINLQLQSKIEQIQEMNLDINEVELIKIKESLQMAELQKLEALRQIAKEKEIIEIQSQEIKKIEKGMKLFYEEANPLLIKDGYLKNGEKIESISVDDDSLIKINGTKIKSKDTEKYMKLIEKHLGKSEGFRIIEE